MLLGAGFRFARLSAKPPWTDEFSTLVFSLGQSYSIVPIDQIISLETLLLPLHFNAQAGIGAIAQGLLVDNVHPPLYFMLAHEWMRWFLPDGAIASIWLARSLPALLGVASIPAIYGLSWLAFRSKLVAQLSAGMMTLSPYALFLAQEARHYTLSILWVIAALAFLVIAVQRIEQQRPIAYWQAILWIVVNALAIATHYLFLITIAASAFVLLQLLMVQARKGRQILLQPHWQRIYFVAIGTATVCLAWLPIWLRIPDSNLTQWIQDDGNLGILALLNPIFQSIATWIAMFALLPVESSALPVVLISGALMIAYFVWAVPLLKRGLQQHPNQAAVRLLVGFLAGAIALFFLITYAGSDLTRGARYNFVYFPAVIVLLGASLAVWWQFPEKIRFRRFQPRPAVLLVAIVGLLSALTVVSNLGYRKYYRPDLLIPLMARSNLPILVATTHNTSIQVGEIMGVGWQLPEEMHSQVQFLFAHADGSEGQTLVEAIAQLPRPFDLWLINFHTPTPPDPQRLRLDDKPSEPINGYRYQQYHCS
ncbi:MAG: glycosyltransferase [Leptolyngbyaceae cyanobacterium SM1_3_5]|nr:glycosyltransferase [Leptolyngbyaceae cyanobacterium SM1_3_5]